MSNVGIVIVSHSKLVAQGAADMAGCSVTLSLLDDNLCDLWDAPVHTAALRWGV